MQSPLEALATYRALIRELGVEERAAGSDRVRLWITLDDGEQATIDIPAESDRLAILELFEKYRASRATRVVSVEQSCTNHYKGSS